MLPSTTLSSLTFDRAHAEAIGSDTANRGRHDSEVWSTGLSLDFKRERLPDSHSFVAAARNLVRVYHPAVMGEVDKEAGGERVLEMAPDFEVETLQMRISTLLLDT